MTSLCVWLVALFFALLPCVRLRSEPRNLFVPDFQFPASLRRSLLPHSHRAALSIGNVLRMGLVGSAPGEGIGNDVVRPTENVFNFARPVVIVKSKNCSRHALSVWLERLDIQVPGGSINAI